MSSFIRALAYLIVNGRVKDKEMCINIYDVRYDDTKPACGMNWPPDIKPITTYLDVSGFPSLIAVVLNIN